MSRVERVEKQETLAEIVAEMRRGFDQSWHDINREWAYGLADRIEAAAKRERGDAAAMREALEYLLKQRDILDFCHNNLGSKTWEDWDKVYNVLRKIIEKAMRALSAPPRNREVGTLTEQQQRFNDFCEKMQHTDKACCGGCPIVHLRMQGVISNSCELAWGQMPYEEGDAK